MQQAIYLLANNARYDLLAARRELIRQNRELGMIAMRLTLLDARSAVKHEDYSPNTVFAMDGIEAVFGTYFIMQFTQDELVFIWAQAAIKMRDRWAADMGLTGRNPQWQNLAMDAVANEQLIRDGIGTAPKHCYRNERITADTDTDDAYRIVREDFEALCTVEDERGFNHLQVGELQDAIEELEEKLPLPVGHNGLFELTVCCGPLPLAVEERYDRRREEQGTPVPAAAGGSGAVSQQPNSQQSQPEKVD